MSCVARQMGRLMLAHGRGPSSTLRDFILARCGAAVGSVELRSWQREGGPLDDASAERMIVEAIGRPPQGLRVQPDSVFGAWYGGTESGALLVLAHGQDRFGLEPLPMDARGVEHVTIRGAKPRGVEGVIGVATRGDGGFASCEAVAGEDPEAREFALRCPVLASDSATLIDLVENRRRRAIGTRALTLFVSPDGTMPGSYVEPSAPSLAAVGSTESHQIGETINGLRSQHGLGPVELEVEQSRELAELLPFFLAAAHDEARAEMADTIVLHVIAGEHVQSEIRDAQFLQLMTTLGAGEGVDRAVVRSTLSPMVRSTLLDPQAQSIAIGVRTNQAGDVAAVMLSTYDRPDVGRYPHVEEALYARLDHARAERGRPPAARLGDANANAAIDYAMGSLELGRGLDGVLGQMLERLAPIYADFQVGYVADVVDPRDTRGVRWPEALLDSGLAGVSLRVGQVSVLGSRWVVELVVVAYVVPPGATDY